MPVSPHQRLNSEVSAFPLLYQAHHRQYIADIPFWLDLARNQGDPVLELGCGTGRVLARLAEAGYRVFGIDHDPGMLVVLQRSVTLAIAASVYLIQADFSAFHLDTRFPLVILPCNTFSTLAPGHRKSTLRCISQHLPSGGIFATSIPNPEIINHLEPTDQTAFEMFFPHPQSGNPVQVSYQVERAMNVVTFVWHYDHLLPDGKVDRLTVTTSHHLSTTDQYLDAFAVAGFEVTGTYGDFDYSAYTPTAPNLILTAQKI